MGKVDIRKQSKDLPAESDVKLAMSASDATVTTLRKEDGSLAVQYVGDLDRATFENTLARIAQGDESSWAFSWEAPAETATGNGAAAGTPFEIDVLMSADTVTQLVDNGYQLYGFKAVQTSQAKGAPVVWFQSTAFRRTMKINWSENYQAYTSVSQIIPGGQIDATDAYDIDRGQTLEVMAGGTGSITGQPDPTQPIYIHNTTTQQCTCGISQVENGNARPLCAFPLFGRQTNEFVPLEQVLLMFATTAINTGTVIEQAFSDGLLIDLTNDPLRQVTYDINLGWGPTDQPWATPVDSRTSLLNLLIQKPSAALTAKRMIAAGRKNGQQADAKNGARTEAKNGSASGVQNGSKDRHSVSSGAASGPAEH